MKYIQEFYLAFFLFYYFCDSRNIIEIRIIELFFQFNFCRDFEYLLKNSDILFDSEYKREIYISFLVQWNERVVIMLSYAELLRKSKRVLIIRSPRASPAIKCEFEASSTLNSYIYFSPRRIKDSVN